MGAILGSGVLVRPAIAAREAGPASLLAAPALLVLCTRVAFGFAEMSRQEPDAGGIAHFVTRAFGRRASVVAGYLFYFAIPFGAAMAGGAVLQTGSRWNLMAFRTRQMWKLVPTDICGSDLDPSQA